MMNTFRLYLCLFLLVKTVDLSAQQALNIADYYPISNTNIWRYTAPEGWKDGDYISTIAKETDKLDSLFLKYKLEVPPVLKINSNNSFYKHYDATKTAKLLVVNKKRVWYFGEAFSNNGGTVVFDQPILWFSSEFTLGHTIDEKRSFTRFNNDGTTLRGTFRITQKIERKEVVTVSAGTFNDCLRIPFGTYWNFGGGSEAKSINVYHYAKNVGVVKASARFIILKNKKKLLNRLVEPNLKSFELN